MNVCVLFDVKISMLGPYQDGPQTSRAGNGGGPQVPRLGNGMFRAVPGGWSLCAELS